MRETPHCAVITFYPSTTDTGSGAYQGSLNTDTMASNGPNFPVEEQEQVPPVPQPGQGQPQQPTTQTTQEGQPPPTHSLDEEDNKITYHYLNKDSLLLPLHYKHCTC